MPNKQRYRKVPPKRIRIQRVTRENGGPKESVNIRQAVEQYQNSAAYRLAMAENSSHYYYDYEMLKALALDVIEKYELIYMTEVVEFLPCARRTASTRGITKDEDIKKALALKKIEAKARMRQNWQREDAAAPLQLAAYKLMSDDHEFSRLGSARQQTNQTETTVTIKLNFDNDPVESDAIDGPDTLELEEGEHYTTLHDEEE